ncbi:MAG: ABC transporter permease [Bacteroidetes bacterium]|nr:MAG: ABC transporter permease [Bacteroidota bacterium]
MHPTWVIAKRELSAFFDSLIGYVVLVLFLLFSGLFTWLAGGDIFFRKQADLLVFFEYAQIILMFFIPAVTMRQIAEERRSGTIELLLTKALSERQFVLGKFVASLIMVAVALAFTLPYYVTVSYLGNIDHGGTLSGYLGLLLLSGAFISIGLFASSITNNQIVAFLLGVSINVVFHLLFGFLAHFFTGLPAEIFSVLSSGNHFDSISRGVVDTKDLIYFASVMLFFLFLAEWNVAKRK